MALPGLLSPYGCRAVVPARLPSLRELLRDQRRGRSPGAEFPEEKLWRLQPDAQWIFDSMLGGWMLGDVGDAGVAG